MNWRFASNMSARSGSTRTFLLIALGIVVVLFGCAPMDMQPSEKEPRWLTDGRASRGNLKVISEAIYNYHLEHGRLPPAYTVDKEGKPLHSWRVLLLPLLGEQELYDQFDLKQPWSSEANRTLISQMPDVYTAPYFQSSRKEGKTPYLAVVDEQVGHTSMLPKKSRSFQEISDGTKNSAVVVEDPGHLAVWTQPDDWDPLELLTLSSIDENEIHGVNVLTADGAISVVNESKIERLVGLIYCDDGRVPSE